MHWKPRVVVIFLWFFKIHFSLFLVRWNAKLLVTTVRWQWSQIVFGNIWAAYRSHESPMYPAHRWSTILTTAPPGLCWKLEAIWALPTLSSLAGLGCVDVTRIPLCNFLVVLPAGSNPGQCFTIVSKTDAYIDTKIRYKDYSGMSRVVWIGYITRSRNHQTSTSAIIGPPNPRVSHVITTCMPSFSLLQSWPCLTATILLFSDNH